ncbi:hypothetical protein Q1695_010903 [Nippostrongylus brasiliensis]|nr:hypothetical protein Q1695_010903 [Nippostrongylus brasiliensis]
MRRVLFPLLLVFLLLIGVDGAVQRLCGVCKVCAEMARFALSRYTIHNFILQHCSSIIPSRVCLTGGELLKNILNSLTTTQFCQLERMCSASTGGSLEGDPNVSMLQSYDVDAINIVLSRVDSLGNFTDLTMGVRSSFDRAITTLAETFPLLKGVRIREDQREVVVVLTNRFLMALDYKLRSETGENLREHLRPCFSNYSSIVNATLDKHS